MGFGDVPQGHIEWHHPIKNFIQIIIDHENNVQFIYNHIQLPYPAISFRVGFNAAGYRLRINDNVTVWQPQHHTTQQLQTTCINPTVESHILYVNIRLVV